MKMTTRTIVVLSDGETYSDLRGCSIIVLTESGIKKLEEEGLAPRDLDEDTDIVTEIGLNCIAI